MCAKYICFRMLFFVLDYILYGTYANSYKYIRGTSNTCSNPCDAISVFAIGCTIVCSQTQGCKGVMFNKNVNTCCVCSSIGVPVQVLDPGKVLYRTTNKTICNRDLVNDVPNSYLSASISYNAVHGPQQGRLHTKRNYPSIVGAWCAGRAPGNDYIQVRFYNIKEVFGIFTQGRDDDVILHYVSSFKVSYSVDCVKFAFVRGPDNEPKIFPGNTDRHTVIQNDLPEPFLAVCVRVHPVTVVGGQSMRFGVMGCDMYF